MTVIFELVVPNGAQNAQNKCGPNADSEEGCSLMNVYFSAQVMSVKSVCSSHQEEVFYSDSQDLSQTFPSFQFPVYKYVPEANSREGG